MEKLIKQLMEQMNKRFDTLEQGMKELKEEIDNTQIENRSYFKHIESQLEQQQRKFPHHAYPFFHLNTQYQFEK